MGSLDYPLTERIADTIAAHGRVWAARHYMLDRRGPKLTALEWRILSRSGR